MKRGIRKHAPKPSKILRQGKDVKTRKGEKMKNGNIAYDILINVAKGHQNGMRAYAAHAIGTPTNINLKVAEAGARLGEKIAEKVRALKNRKAAVSFDAMADRAVKHAESRDLTDEEAEELGL